MESHLTTKHFTIHRTISVTPLTLREMFEQLLDGVVVEVSLAGPPCMHPCRGETHLLWLHKLLVP